MEKTLIQRLEVIEGQNRRLKAVVMVALLSLSGLVVMGQSTPVAREVKAQKFSLYDSNGKSRGMMFTNQDQAILVLADPDGEPRLTMTVAKDGTPAVGLFDKGDKIRVELSSTHGNPRLTLYSSDERPRILANLGKDGSPTIGLIDGNKSPRIVLGTSGGAWGVAVFDTKGNQVARHPVKGGTAH